MIEYSVIIPTYRGARKLPIILDSLLRQSVSPERFEVIIVDDGSPDDHLAHLEALPGRYSELRIELIHLPINMGPAVARNVGIKAAKGGIVFFTDDDCEVPALWMASHLEIYHQYPEISSVGGWYRVPVRVLENNIFETLINLRHETYYYLYNAVHSQTVPGKFFGGFPAINTANLSVRSCVLQLVSFDERLMSGHEDGEFSMAIRLQGFNAYYMPQFILHHKILTFRSLMRMAHHRGLGIYIRNSFDFTLEENPYGGWKTTKKFIALATESSVPLKQKKFLLLSLNYAYCFVHSSWILHPFKVKSYRLHKKRIARLNSKTIGTLFT